jgi:hypothetical protein
MIACGIVIIGCIMIESRMKLIAASASISLKYMIQVV